MRMTYHRCVTTLSLLLLILFTYAGAAGLQQQHIADKVLRLHVIADSDDPEAQRVKLCVRDAVLAYAAPLLERAQDQAEVRAILSKRLQALADVAQAELRRQGSADQVTAQLAEDWYPTREYTGFSLPAGRYAGLRLTIGTGKGRNWWCVIFPPLCDGAAAQETALTADERAFTRQDGTEYVVRFKAAELLGEIRAFFQG